jgi:protein-disulfide isomerase
MPIPSTQDAVAGESRAASRPPAAQPWALAVGAILLCIAIFASGAMALAHMRGLSIPGCGAGSPCATVAASKWGSIPIAGLNWPVSYIGLTYFAALLGAWLLTRGAVGMLVKLVTVAGAFASAMFIGVMLSESAMCRYCLATHGANFAFVGLIFLAGKGAAAAPAIRGLAAVAGMFLLATATLAGADRILHKEAQQKAGRELDASVAEIQAKMQRDAQQAAIAAPVTPPTPAPTQPVAAALPPTPAPQPAPPQTAAPVAQPAQAAATEPSGFTGRWRFGPEQAGIRVVLFTGYQCPDCQRVEMQLMDALAKIPSLSVSIKHFPFNSECNPAAPTLHSNACWAARAAETAGLLGGQSAFQKMHIWLFEKKGVFITREDIEQGIRQAGLDPNQFLPMMGGDAPMRNIKADIDEALALGIGQTPFIFVNGVELKGWNANPTAVYDALAALAATNPPAAGPENDRPPRAFVKYLSEWRANPAMAWPQREKPYYMGPAQAPINITVFGDLQEPNTAQADTLIREYIAGRPDIRYEYRYFPVDPDCNPDAPRMPGMAGCRAARAAEAAGQLGGDAAYWAMHQWLMANQKSFGDDALRGVAPQIGLDPDALLSTMNSPEVSAIIAGDVDIGKRMRITSIPRIHVNGKHVPRWQIPGGGLLETIIEEAPTLPPEGRPIVLPVDPVQSHPLLRQLRDGK